MREPIAVQPMDQPDLPPSSGVYQLNLWRRRQPSTTILRANQRAARFSNHEDRHSLAEWPRRLRPVRLSII
jgi:hypothetical protein